VAGVEATGAMTDVEAAKRGVEQAEKVIVLGAGAQWINTVASHYFPGAERRLDVWHLVQRCREGYGPNGWTPRRRPNS